MLMPLTVVISVVSAGSNQCLAPNLFVHASVGTQLSGHILLLQT